MFHGLASTFNVTALAPGTTGAPFRSGPLAEPHQLQSAVITLGADAPFSPTAPFQRTPIWGTPTKPAPVKVPSKELPVMVGSTSPTAQVPTT